MPARFVTFIALALFAGIAAASQTYRVETLVTGLEHPWSLAWLPDGRMLVTERPGRLRIIAGGELLPEPVAGLPQPHTRSQAGLFEVLPAPDFSMSGLLYLSLVVDAPGGNTLIVVRGRLHEHALVELEEVFRHQPVRRTSVHYGGRMAFLPDGSLLLTLGDGFDYREQAQRLSNHFGSVVRLLPDGSAHPDNPFRQSRDALPHIYAYGLRNVQGLALDTATGTLWITDHGPRGGDRLHILRPGTNYGWPITSHALDYTGARITPYRELPGVQPPVHTWTPAIAPAGLTVYRGALFPHWQGDLFVAGLAGRSVRHLQLRDGRIVGEQVLFADLGRRFREVRAGPDGALYLLTDHADGELLRIVPAR